MEIRDGNKKVRIHINIHSRSHTRICTQDLQQDARQNSLRGSRQDSQQNSYHVGEAGRGPQLAIWTHMCTHGKSVFAHICTPRLEIRKYTFVSVRSRVFGIPKLHLKIARCLYVARPARDKHSYKRAVAIPAGAYGPAFQLT